MRARRERIDDEKIDPASQEVDRFGNELPNGEFADLIPRRDDFYHRDDFAEVVADRDPVGSLVKPALAGLNDHPRAWGPSVIVSFRERAGLALGRCTVNTSG